MMPGTTASLNRENFLTTGVKDTLFEITLVTSLMRPAARLIVNVIDPTQ